MASNFSRAVAPGSENNGVLANALVLQYGSAPKAKKQLSNKYVCKKVYLKTYPFYVYQNINKFAYVQKGILKNIPILCIPKHTERVCKKVCLKT